MTLTLAMTAGDPCGIGPEVVLKALARWPGRRRTNLIVIGDLTVFEQTARRLRQRLPEWDVIEPGAVSAAPLDPVTFLDCGHRSRFTPGRSSTHASRAALEYLDLAIRLWQARRIQALVTAPVTKWAIAAAAAPNFIGQTEYLARAMGVRDAAMMFVSNRLRVVLLTRHLPIGRVPRAITPRLLRTTIRLTIQALRTQFQISRPRLALCGLNPHAGEEGQIGREERTVIVPVLSSLRQRGLTCDGPFAADGFFASRHRYDTVICPYHDQGLIPFKLLARDRGCQLSLGLPVVRTSPDHGSALDIAGRGLAHPGSMIYALELAARLIGKRPRQMKPC
jgi:4-hydroxythreonine-4-phosphate dehydrogenase